MLGGHLQPAQVAGRAPLAAFACTQHPALDEHRHELLDEERVALGGRGRSRRGSGAAARAPPGMFAMSASASASASRPRASRVDASPSLQAGRDVEDRGPRGADDEHGASVDALDEVLDEVEQRRRRPVHVVDHDDQRPVEGEASPESVAQAPEELGQRQLLRRPVERRCDAARDLAIAAHRLEPSERSRPAHPRRSPVASRTIASSGQNVIDSPYGRQRPRRTMGLVARGVDQSSRTRRLLPTPASPITVASRQRRSPIARSYIASASRAPPHGRRAGARWRRAACSSPVTRGGAGTRRPAAPLPLSSSGRDGVDLDARRAPGDRSAHR